MRRPLAYLPVSHGRHPVLSVVGYDPEAQLPQAFPASENFPVGHGVQKRLPGSSSSPLRTRFKLYCGLITR